MSEQRPLTYDDFIKAIRTLEENSYHPDNENWYVPIDSSLWNGFWYVRSRYGFFGRLCRRIGRKLRWSWLYRIGREVFWATGLKDLMEYEKEET